MLELERLGGLYFNAYEAMLWTGGCPAKTRLRGPMPQGSIAIVRDDCLHVGGTNVDGTCRRAISLS